jgi:hypothetical protein
MPQWETALAWAASLVVIALTAVTLYSGAHEIVGERQAREVNARLRTLAALTIRNFPEKNLDSAELFWKAIGREGDPMKDPWGTPYHLSQRDDAAGKAYLWTSAGPDGVLATRDDIEVEVPYPSTPLTVPEGEPATTGNSMPAK